MSSLFCLGVETREWFWVADLSGTDGLGRSRRGLLFFFVNWAAFPHSTRPSFSIPLLYILARLCLRLCVCRFNWCCETEKDGSTWIHPYSYFLPSSTFFNRIKSSCQSLSSEFRFCPSSRVPFPQPPIVSEEKTKLRRIAVRPGPSLVVTLVRKGNRAINRASAQN